MAPRIAASKEMQATDRPRRRTLHSFTSIVQLPLHEATHTCAEEYRNRQQYRPVLAQDRHPDAGDWVADYHDRAPDDRVADDALTRRIRVCLIQQPHGNTKTPASA